MSFSLPWKLNPRIFHLNPNFSSARERAQTLTLKFKGFVKVFLMSFSWPWKLNPTIFQLNPNFSSARERAQTLTLKFKGFVKAFLFTLKAKPSFLIKEYFCESTKFGDVNIDMYIYI